MAVSSRREMLRRLLASRLLKTHPKSKYCWETEQHLHTIKFSWISGSAWAHQLQGVVFYWGDRDGMGGKESEKRGGKGDWVQWKENSDFWEALSCWQSITIKFLLLRHSIQVHEFSRKTWNQKGPNPDPKQAGKALAQPRECCNLAARPPYRS